MSLKPRYRIVWANAAYPPTTFTLPFMPAGHMINMGTHLLAPVPDHLYSAGRDKYRPHLTPEAYLNAAAGTYPTPPPLTPNTNAAAQPPTYSVFNLPQP